MGKLYETNKQMDDLLLQLKPDEETGELPENTDEIIEQINALQADKDEILNWMAKEVLNIRANFAGIKAEQERLAKYRKSQEALADRLVAILDYECAGQNTDFGIAKLTHRKSQRTDVTDPDMAIAYLQQHGHDDMLKYKKPDVDKTAVKGLIKRGVPVPGVELVDSISVSLS